MVVQPPPGAMSLSLVVPMTFMDFPSAEISSIILVVSGWITRLCFFAKASSIQSTEAPVSGRALSVARYSSWFFFALTLRLTMGVGQPVTPAEFTAGFDIKHFAFVVCLTIFAALTEKDIFFWLLFLM